MQTKVAPPRRTAKIPRRAISGGARGRDPAVLRWAAKSMGANRAPARCVASRWMCAAVVLVVGVAPAVGCGSGGETGPDAAPPTGDPATGPGGGSNLTCGHASFASDAALYQDISAAPLDP